MKQKFFLSSILLFSLISSVAQATNYYVSGSGNDGNNGLTISKPFLTIQKASDLTNPGDTVFVMNGTYTNSNCSTCSVVDITRSGSSAAWIVYIAYPGEYPKLQYNGWAGFNVDASAYIQITGFEVIGNNANMDSVTAYGQRNNGNNPLTSGNGISVQPIGTTYPHHVIISHDIVHDWGGGGISSQNADYLTVEENIVYNTSWYSVYDPSGISIGWCSNFDSDTTDYKIIVRRNLCYNNKNEIPDLYGGGISDGEGIIIDIQDGSAGGVPAYTGRMIVENNICFNNGGDGITLFKTNNVDVINNTCYLNDESSSVNRGQIAPNQGKNTRIYNNILYALAGKNVNFNCCPNTNLSMDYNVYWSSSGSPSASLLPVFSPHDQKADPMFVNASVNAAVADFHLQPGSSCIGNGTSSLAPNIDYDGNPRPSGSGFDIGAYQYVITTSLPAITNPACLLVYPNPATEQITVDRSACGSPCMIDITNAWGEKVYEHRLAFTNEKAEFQIAVSGFSKGIYFLKIQNNLTGDMRIAKFIKG